MKIRKLAVALCLALLSWSSQSQTISDFENLSLPVDTFWNGADYSGGFSSGNTHYPNVYLYDSLYGGYWASGWAYSSMRDSTTGNFTNLYSARPAIGYDGSATYAIGQQGSVLHLTGDAAGKVVYGVFVTNSTYAALSMRDGDAFAKKFGGPTGDDPDWFKLCIRAWFNGVLKPDSVEFFLADYRFSDNLQDYIVNDWQWVPLSSLGNCDSLQFLLSSTDNGTFGMNTPPFFCIDNFSTTDSLEGMEAWVVEQPTLFPNPATDLLQVSLPGDFQMEMISVFDMQGQCVYSKKTRGVPTESLDVRRFSSGYYEVVVESDRTIFVGKFLKK